MTIRNLHIPYHIRIVYSLNELEAELKTCLEKLNGKSPFYCFDPILYKDKELIDLRYNIEMATKEEYCQVIENSLLDTAQKIQREALEKRCDIIVSIGGGKCLDVAKYAAAQLGIPFITIPTQAAHDGICSPVAVLEMKGITYSLPARSPEAVLINMPTIMNSPKRALCAGIGDLLSNITAEKDWRLAEKRQGEKFDDFAALLATLGPDSLLNSKNQDLTDMEFVENLIKGLILSGISMEMAGSSRPSSGSEHQISHAIDQLFPKRETLHGEQVAFGTMVSSVLWDYQPNLLRDFMQKFKLPVTISALGFNRNDFLKIIDKAPQTRPGRYTILNEIISNNTDWLQKLENYGVLG